jgi:molybdate transport system regulatory protein
MKVKCRIYIAEGDKHIVGDGKIRLLEAVDRLGSVNLASKEFGLSYPHAWRYIHELEESFERKMVETKIGGKGGGGAVLTEFAKELVSEYNKFREPLDGIIEKHFGKSFKNFLSRAKQK